LPINGQEKPDKTAEPLFTGMDRINRMKATVIMALYPVHPVDPCEFDFLVFPGTDFSR
jgi:hypothetical protein